MDGGSPVLIGILILLICGSAFFSASETALTSLSRIRLRNMVDEKIKNADKIQRLLDTPSKLLSSILVGNNLSLIHISPSAFAVHPWLRQ